MEDKFITKKGTWNGVEYTLTELKEFANPGGEDPMVEIFKQLEGQELQFIMPTPKSKKKKK